MLLRCGQAGFTRPANFQFIISKVGRVFMAQCDRGYLCEVCGDEVEDLEGSDLYLRYILGEVAARDLLSSPERHLCCNPTLSQFIVDPRFPPVVVEGVFSKSSLDPASVAAREELVSRGFRRLLEVRELGIPVNQYPLSRASGGD